LTASSHVEIRDARFVWRTPRFAHNEESSLAHTQRSRNFADMKKLERRNSSEGVVIQRGASQLPAGLRYKRVEGALSKKSRDRQKIARRLSNDSGWRVRFFVLENDALLYYASEQVRLQPQPPVRGHMSLQGLTLTRSLDERELRALQPPRAFAQFVIKLAPQDEAQGGRPLYLHATNEREYLKWCDALQHNIYLTNNPRGGRFAATGFAGVDEDHAVVTEMSAPGNMRPNRQRAMTTGSAPLPGLDVELSPERAGTAPPNSQPLPSRVGPSAAAAAAAQPLPPLPALPPLLSSHPLSRAPLSSRPTRMLAEPLEVMRGIPALRTERWAPVPAPAPSAAVGRDALLPRLPKRSSRMVRLRVLRADSAAPTWLGLRLG